MGARATSRESTAYQRQSRLAETCFPASGLESKSELCLSPKGVTTNEQVAIFLYTVSTGLTMRKIAERFQRSMSTIHKYVIC